MVTVAPHATEHMQLVVVGHVDHGKSTLLGRLYADTGSLPDGKLEKVQAICRQQGKEFEYAFLFDAFLEEQQQGITIDTARTFFSWQDRQYVVIDAPGHKEFLKNMVSGAARAEAALLVIDAREGVQEQSRKHGHLLSLLGIRQVAVVVNKMDLVAYDRPVFEAIEAEFRAFLEELGVRPERFVPASARHGDNVAAPSARLAWYAGPTVLETLGLFRKQMTQERLALRFPIQDVYKFDARRIIAGRVASGCVRVGDRLVFSPSNKSAHVRSIEAFNVDPLPLEAVGGQSIGITLDEQVFLERGEIGSHEGSPPGVATTLRCNLFWMGKRPLEMGRKYLLRLATREVECEVVEIRRIIDAADLAALRVKSAVGKNEVAELVIRTKAPIAFDLYQDFEVTGRFVLVDQYDVAGGGIIVEAVPDAQTSLREEARRRDLSWVTRDVGTDERAERYGHRAALVLLTGSAALTSRLARELERRLVLDGRHAYLLDTTNIRRGLAEASELNTRESTRRFGELVHLLVDSGMIVVFVAGALRQDEQAAIQALLHPTPLVVVQAGPQAGDPASHADLALNDVEDAAAAVDRIIAELTRQAVLADPTDHSRRLLYPSYSI